MRYVKCLRYPVPFSKSFSLAPTCSLFLPLSLHLTISASPATHNGVRLGAVALFVDMSTREMPFPWSQHTTAHCNSSQLTVRFTSVH